jgi:hypothetical protein
MFMFPLEGACIPARLGADPLGTSHRNVGAGFLPISLLIVCLSAILIRMKRVSVFLTEQQIAALHALAAQTGLKFAELLRRIIDNALGRQRPR